MSGADGPPVVVHVEPKPRRFRVTLHFDIEAKDYQDADDFVQADPYSSTYDALDGISVEIEERKP